MQNGQIQKVLRGIKKAGTGGGARGMLDDKGGTSFSEKRKNNCRATGGRSCMTCEDLGAEAEYQRKALFAPGGAGKIYSGL